MLLDSVEFPQIFRLGVMTTGESFDLWFENRRPVFVPLEVYDEIDAGPPDVVRVLIDCFEYTQQMLNIRVIRRDPLRFSEVLFCLNQP